VWSRVVDPAQGVAANGHGQVPVSRLDPRSHATEGLGDPPHRPRRERVVAGELELLPVLAGKDAGEQPDERPRVRAVDRARRRREPAEPLPEDAQRVVTVLVDVDPERAHRRDRRLGVGGAAEAGHTRLAVAERADQHRTVRDRLVAGHGEMTDEPRDRLDGRHSSITGATTTP
jgi:hypothetical protein